MIGEAGHPDWDPGTLAADTLAALTLDLSQASKMAANCVSIDQKRELNRYKYLTSHLDRLVSYLQSGPAKDQLVGWIELGKHLP